MHRRHFVLLMLCLVWYKVPCSPDWPWICSTAEASLQPLIFLLLFPWLRLQVGTTMPRYLGDKFKRLWHIVLYYIWDRQTAGKTGFLESCLCLFKPSMHMSFIKYLCPHKASTTVKHKMQVQLWKWSLGGSVGRSYSVWRTCPGHCTSPLKGPWDTCEVVSVTAAN